MKKAIVLIMALALVAFSLPALAQDIKVGSGDANNNMVTDTGGTAKDNSINKGASNSTYVDGGAQAHYGDMVNVNSNNTINYTRDVTNDVTVTLDTKTTTETEITNTTKTNITVGQTNSYGTLDSGNSITALVGLDNSLNGNEIYVADNFLGTATMKDAWKSAHTNEHQYDHQLNFATTWTGARDATIYMPISNVHLQQTNTGIGTGDNAGAVANSVAAINAVEADVSGMFGMNVNVGGVGTNQAAMNVITAFAASNGPIAP